MNRQAFTLKDVGQNKAEITSQLIKSINPEVNIRVEPRFLLEEKDIIEAVKRNDFIINMSDPNEAMYYISEVSHYEKKIELHPLNVGWIGYCLIITNNTPSLKEIVGRKVYGNEFYYELISKTIDARKIEGILKTSFKDVDIGKLIQNTYFPQLGITSYLTSALVVGAIIRLIEKDPTIPIAPQALISDLRI